MEIDLKGVMIGKYGPNVIGDGAWEKDKYSRHNHHKILMPSHLEAMSVDNDLHFTVSCPTCPLSSVPFMFCPRLYWI